MSSRAKPFSFEYVGVHPAGLWLMRALQRHHHSVKVNTTLSHALASDATQMENAPYLVNDLPWRQLGESVVYWPFEWQEQRVQACVTASLQAQGLLIHQSQPLQLMQLDYQRLTSHLYQALQVPSAIAWINTHAETGVDTEADPDLQPLCLRWSWHPPPAESLQKIYVFSAHLQRALTPWGVMHHLEGDACLATLIHHPQTCGTQISLAVKAQSLMAARAQLRQDSLLNHLWAGDVQSKKDFLKTFEQVDFEPTAWRWPEINRVGHEITICSELPQSTLASAYLEGVCWGLVAHLLRFLNTRYSTPEEVFDRLKDVDQKMRRVFAPFL